MSGGDGGGVSELLCPRCRTPLVAGQAPDVTLHGCGECGGVWLGNADSQQAVKGLSPVATGMVRTAADNATREADRRSWVACPVCANRMERTTLANAQVEIDYCAQHGTWFDRMELYDVSRAASGTLAPSPVANPVFAADYPSDPFVAPHTSGLAIAGFVLSFFCGLIGFALSIGALSQIRSSRGKLKGEGLAIAGIVISVVGMALGLCFQMTR